MRRPLSDGRGVEDAAPYGGMETAAFCKPARQWRTEDGAPYGVGANQCLPATPVQAAPAASWGGTLVAETYPPAVANLWPQPHGNATGGRG